MKGYSVGMSYKEVQRIKTINKVLDIGRVVLCLGIVGVFVYMAIMAG